jgi:hypothetical protein
MIWRVCLWVYLSYTYKVSLRQHILSLSIHTKIICWKKFLSVFLPNFFSSVVFQFDHFFFYFTVFLFSGITPTPFIPFSVQQKHAAVGIVITASHNPKDDNGYKVYWSNGPQVRISSEHIVATPKKIMPSVYFTCFYNLFF